MMHITKPHVPLALRPREAAKALAISERTLWALTAPRGPIPCTRTSGRLVLYRTADLDRWLRDNALRSQTEVRDE